MGKSKASKGPKHIQARILYLQEAAHYLAEQQLETDGAPGTAALDTCPTMGNSHRLNSDLRSISRKLVIRLPEQIKHSLCKVCDAPMVEGKTSLKRVENQSRGKQKACADVLVVQCQACGTPKRFPIGAERQAKKRDRPLKAMVPGEEKGKTNSRPDKPDSTTTQGHEGTISDGISAGVPDG